MHEDLFRKKVTEHVMYQLNMEKNNPDLANRVNEHYKEMVITKLVVQSAEHQRKSIEILVSRPSFVSYSPTGRLTRGCVLVKGAAEDSEVVFIEDTWRSNEEGGELEGDILRCLTRRE